MSLVFIQKCRIVFYIFVEFIFWCRLFCRNGREGFLWTQWNNNRRNCSSICSRCALISQCLCFAVWIWSTHWCGHNTVSLQTRWRNVPGDVVLLLSFVRCVSWCWAWKKAEPFVTYLVPRYRQAPNRINKYEQFTPHSVNFYLLILNGLSIWRFSEQRIRAKAQYLISIWMETLFLNYMNSVHLSKWHYLLIFYIYLIVYVSFYFLFLIFYFYWYAFCKCSEYSFLLHRQKLFISFFSWKPQFFPVGISLRASLTAVSVPVFSGCSSKGVRSQSVWGWAMLRQSVRIGRQRAWRQWYGTCNGRLPVPRRCLCPFQWSWGRPSLSVL